jgi:hypothetical protein
MVAKAAPAKVAASEVSIFTILNVFVVVTPLTHTRMCSRNQLRKKKNRLQRRLLLLLRKKES